MIERMLIFTAWAVKKLASYTMSALKTVIVLPNASEATCAQFIDMPVRLQACIVELLSYNCSFESGDGAWVVQGRIAQELATSEKDERTPAWIHEKDIPIQMPSTLPALEESSCPSTYSIFFDGGCLQYLGSGGYMVFAPNGEGIGGQGRWYGDRVVINYEAEAWAVADSPTFLDKLQLPLG